MSCERRRYQYEVKLLLEAIQDAVADLARLRIRGVRSREPADRERELAQRRQ
jgi:hypothetical protein